MTLEEHTRPRYGRSRRSTLIGLTARSGVSLATLYKVVAGHRMTNITKARAIAKATRGAVTVEELT